MTEPRLCARCGAPLPAGSDDCPRCLLRLGLELPPRDPSGGAETGPPPPPRLVALPLEEVARLFPQLEILGLIGQGGMGVVYRARQPRLDRVVALKLLPPEMTADGDFAERFLREARAMARLSHPHIVAVHDFGENDGLCWLIMEHVDGVNLREALRAGTLTPEKAFALVPQMCEALQYAHDEGVVHRDIKPENVLIDRLGRVRIADFGLAKLAGRGDITLTGERQVFGTPHYMAPEQMEAARDVDHRADIFSLGVVFYEMLTGKLPLGRFEPPSRRVAVDVRVDEIVLHALEHEPERRYQHAADVKTDVESVAHGGEPEAARAEGRDAAPAGTPAPAAAAAPRLSVVSAVVRLLAGLVLVDVAAAILLNSASGWAEDLLGLAVMCAVFCWPLLLYGAVYLVDAEGEDALSDPQAVGVDVLCWLAAGVGALAFVGGLVNNFQEPGGMLAATGGGLLVAQALGLWWLRRWAGRHPQRARALGGAFESKVQSERERRAAREAARAKGGKGWLGSSALVIVGGTPPAEVQRAAAEAAELVGADAPAPAAAPRRSWRRSFWRLWVIAAMLIWPPIAWMLAGQMATAGWEGVAAGALLIAATAWCFVQIVVRGTPTLRDALRGEPAWLKALRALLAWPLALAGAVLLGLLVLERWERDSEHYLSDARSPQAVYAGGRNEVGSALALVARAPLQGFDREVEHAFFGRGMPPVETEVLAVAGVLLLLASAAVSTLRLPGAKAWDTCWWPIVLVPLLLVVGLRLSAAWAASLHQAERWPSRVSVSGEQSFATSIERTRDRLGDALEAEGLQLHAGQTSKLKSATDGRELGTEIVMAFETPEPWVRWDLAEGQPRRRQPHVVVRLVGREDSCVVLWDCGDVRPIAAEPQRWTEWMQRILGEAGGF
jgi:Protein kinase domain